MCEICGRENKTDVMAEELESFAGSDFLVRAGPREQKKKIAVFCIDISGFEKSNNRHVFYPLVLGSMSSTIEAPKDMKLLNVERATERRLALERELAQVIAILLTFVILNLIAPAQFMEAGANQNFGRSNQVKFLSRLECVQAAAHSAISQLIKSLPDHLPVLVTFASDVKVYHLDGTVTTKAGDSLNDLNGKRTELKVLCLINQKTPRSVSVGQEPVCSGVEQERLGAGARDCEQDLFAGRERVNSLGPGHGSVGGHCCADSGIDRFDLDRRAGQRWTWGSRSGFRISIFSVVVLPFIFL